MAKTLFSFQECSFIANRDEFRTCESIERSILWDKNSSYGLDDSKGTNSRFDEVNSMEENSILSQYIQIHEQDQNLLPYIDSEILYNQEFNISEFKADQNSFSLASLELLKKYGNSRPNSARTVDKISNDSELTIRNLSTEEIIRIAGARFIQSCYQVVDIASMLNNPFRFSLSDISNEDSENIELVELLLASAEKVGYQQFERATRLLSHCNFLCSNTGNPVQRIVHYFSKALRDRIDRETGKFSLKNTSKEQELCRGMPSFQEASFWCYQKVPFYQVARFTGIQAILENVAGSKRIHIIDLEIRLGAHWAALIQALQSKHDFPLEYLKITAIGIGTSSSSKTSIEDTCKRLASFAESMNIPFRFNVVKVADFMELKEDLFDRDSKESLAIYSEHLLTRLISETNWLEHIMKLITKMNPCVMVVMETEANTNSPSFVNRFVEALFFYSAYFDCFDVCMDRNDLNRQVTESMFFAHGISNIVASEGKERRVRHVKVDVWRAFFARFGMKETELSPSSLYQADLVLKQFGCGSYCTLDVNEKCLLIGWKGTPISSLSVWKFS